MCELTLKVNVGRFFWLVDTADVLIDQVHGVERDNWEIMGGDQEFTNCEWFRVKFYKKILAEKEQ